MIANYEDYPGTSKITSLSLYCSTEILVDPFIPYVHLSAFLGRLPELARLSICMSDVDLVNGRSTDHMTVANLLTPATSSICSIYSARFFDIGALDYLRPQQKNSTVSVGYHLGHHSSKGCLLEASRNSARSSVLQPLVRIASRYTTTNSHQPYLILAIDAHLPLAGRYSSIQQLLL